jgi:hypothetical protein
MLNKDTPKHLLSETVKGIIWKIVLDDELEIIVIESRTTDKKVYFYAYDFKNSTFLIKDKIFDETWHLGLINIVNGIIYFHGLENEHAPTHKNIIAYRLIDDKILWQNYTHAANQIFKDGIVAFNSRILPRKLELIDLKTGAFLKNILPEDILKLKIISNQIIIPENIHGNDNWETQQILKWKELTISSFYKQNENKINHILQISSKNEVIYKDLLNEDIQKLVEDTFFVWLGKLVYIRNKSEIVSYLL